MFGKLDTAVATDGLTAGSSGSYPSDSTSNYQLAMCSNSSSVQTITYEVPAGEHFIDINNLCTTTIDVPIDVRKKMLLVIETEPQKEIQATFEQIYSIVVCGGLLFPKTYDKVITDLEAFAKTLN